MYDEFKIPELPTTLENLLVYFNIPMLVEEGTGAIMEHRNRSAEYRNLVCTLRGPHINLKGSFQKYSNDGLHNYNDFKFSLVCATIDDIVEKLKINPDDTFLSNLAWGVNIVTPFDPDIFIDGLVNYKGTPFAKMKYGYRGKECVKNNFIIKIYNKGFQYIDQIGTYRYILRIEIKVLKMRFFSDNDVNLKSISDTKNPTIFSQLGTLVQEYFSDILFFDKSLLETMDLTSEEQKIVQGRFPEYWTELLPKSKRPDGKKNPNYNKQRKHYYKTLNEFKDFIKQYNADDFQKQCSDLIKSKISELSDFDSPITKLKTYTDDNNEGYKFTEIDLTAETDHLAQIHPLSIVGICTPNNIPKRYCQTCRKDITNQRKGSKFCSAKYVGYEAAHRCRNRDTNPKHNLKKRIDLIKENKDVLFSTIEFIKLTQEQKEISSFFKKICR